MHLKLHNSRSYQTIKTGHHVSHLMTCFTFTIRLWYLYPSNVKRGNLFSYHPKHGLDVNVMIPLRESMSNVFYQHNSRLFE